MERNGSLVLQFSEEIIKPSFLEPGNESARHLFDLQAIDVTQDLFEVELELFDDEARENLTFSLSLEAWNTDSLRLVLNFTNPQLISRALTKDKIYMEIKDPSLFVAVRSGMILET